MTFKKRFVLLPLLAALIYTGYWFVAIKFIEDGFVEWVAQEIRTNEANIQFTNIERTGFPFTLRLIVDDLIYVQTQKDMIAKIPSLHFEVNPLNWHQADYMFPEGIEVALYDQGQKADINAKKLSGSITTPWTKEKTVFSLIFNEVELDFPAKDTGTNRPQLKIAKASLNFTATPALPRILSDPGVTQWRQKKGGIKLHNTGLQIGQSEANITGKISLSEANQPQFSGQLLLIRGHELLNQLQQTKRINTQHITMAKNFLKTFEKAVGHKNQDGIKIPIFIRAGFLSIGPFPIFPIPQFHWSQEVINE